MCCLTGEIKIYIINMMKVYHHSFLSAQDLILEATIINF